MSQLDKADRQAVILALARLSLERPGWVYYLGEIAARFQARPMYDDFRNLTADLSASPEPPDRTDSVELLGGVTHLPAEFREVARLANDAGLAGYEFLHAEVGLEVPAELKARGAENLRVGLQGEEAYSGWRSQVTIKYRRKAKPGMPEAGKA